MRTLHEQNKNLSIVDGFIYNGLPLYDNKGQAPMIEQYLVNIESVIDRVLEQHTRLFAIRVDLHIPPAYNTTDEPLQYDSKVITRFIESFKARIRADLVRKSKVNQRVHPTSVNYIWCKEVGDTGYPHYHLVLLLNNDTYNSIGSFDVNANGLFAKMAKAWASALNYDLYSVKNLITIPKDGLYYLNGAKGKQDHNYQSLFKRISYFAKADTKTFGNRERSFGYSYR